jgi:hypothetical protein
MNRVSDVHTPPERQEHQINNGRPKSSVMGVVSGHPLGEHTDFKTESESVVNKLSSDMTFTWVFGIPNTGVAVKIASHVQQTRKSVDVVPDKGSTSCIERVRVDVEKMHLHHPIKRQERYIAMINNVGAKGRTHMFKPSMDIDKHPGSLRLKSPVNTRSGTTENGNPVRMSRRTYNRIPFQRGRQNSGTNHTPGRFLDEKEIKVVFEQLQ